MDHLESFLLLMYNLSVLISPSLRTTCDFSGTAILVVSESSATDDTLNNDQRTINVRSLFLGPFAGLLILCLFGFIVRQSLGLNNYSNSDGEQMPILAHKSADETNGLPIKQG